jgi:hypothetical protein
MSLYDKIYKNDNPETPAHGWIRWKGTNVCMDVYCLCGHHGHVDTYFFYRYECPKCHRKYAVGEIVKLIEMTPELLKEEASESGESHKYYSDIPPENEFLR